MPEELALTNNLVLEFNPLPAWKSIMLTSSRRRWFFLYLATCGAFFILAVPASAQFVGQQETFNVEPVFDHASRQSIVATLRSIGTKSLVYVEDAYFNSLSSTNRQLLDQAAQATSAEFDGNIYPKLTDLYGKPAEPGVDGDPRTTLLMAHMRQNAGGYFNTTDSFTKQQSSKSNEREMLYINAAFYTNSRQMYGFISHEFTHLIDFNQKHLLRGVDGEVWLNELRAEYAATVAGYDKPYAGSNVASRVASFLSEPERSLTEWLNEGEDYAVVNIFAQYVVGKYGDAVLRHSMLTEKTGIASLEYGLLQAGVGKSFTEVYEDWLVASFVNTAQPGPEYVYDNADLTQATIRISKATADMSLSPSATASITRETKDWAGQWIRITPTGSVNDTLTITVSSSVPLRVRALLRDLNGVFSLVSFTAADSSAWISIGNILGLKSIVVIPVLMGKREGFSTGEVDAQYDQEVLRTYTVSAQRTQSNGPVIGAVSPPIVLPSGNILVTVTGSGFSGSSVSLTIDGQPVSPTVISDTELRVVVPAHAKGSACLTLTVGPLTTERCDILTYGTYAGGSLLRAEGDFRVWIVQGDWRRHIVTADIFGFYGHLVFAEVTTVSQETLAQMRISSWVRVPITADPATWRVYEVNADETKHWITCADPNNCGATWITNGGDPAGIFTINQAEMDRYTTGPHVFLQ